MGWSCPSPLSGIKDTARCRYSRPITYLQDLLGPVRNQTYITFLPFSRHPSTTQAGSLLSRHSNKNVGLLFVISPWTGLHWMDSPSTDSSVKEHHQHIHPRWVNKLMVAERRVNYRHQMQQQDTRILSTRSCYKDEWNGIPANKINRKDGLNFRKS